tara:strand:- start:1421 stop:1648 length:228 start_codon:yes stop_codon:yes gene_type:complete
MYKYITSSVKTIPNNDVEETANSILQASDWTQLPDSGLTDNCVALFKTYRASIRTIRRTNPSNPTWPDAPTEEWS